MYNRSPPPSERPERAPAKRDVGRQPDGLPLPEGRVEAAARGGAVRAAHNQLGDHRVVKDRHVVSYTLGTLLR